MKNESSFAAKCGRFFGNLIIGCIATCISAIVIVATVRFIMWII